jgi:hypothetical protein
MSSARRLRRVGATVSQELEVWLQRKELVVDLKIRLHVYCSYSETVIITVLKSIARI